MLHPMTALREILLSPGHASRLTTELTALVRDHIDRRSGIRGTAYRTGLAMVERARPGIVDRAARKLLPPVVEALEPFYTAYQASEAASSRLFSSQLQQQSAEVVDAIMVLADQQAAAASDTVRKVYERFRGGAQEELRAMLPPLGLLIDQHLQDPRRVAE